MKKVFLMLSFLMLCFLATSVAHAQSKGSAYLGKWEGSVESLTGREGACHLEISRVGESFTIESKRQTIGNCEAYVGIFTLTPEGNLKGNIIIAYDKPKNRAIVSGLGKLRYLLRPTVNVDAFAGTWQLGNGGPGSQLLRIEDTNDGRFRVYEGWSGLNNQKSWNDVPIPCELTNGRPTHGAEFVYDVTIEGINDNELKYTVRSDLGTESTKARRTK
jgi:hypothetical protein